MVRLVFRPYTRRLGDERPLKLGHHRGHVAHPQRFRRDVHESPPRRRGFHTLAPITLVRFGHAQTLRRDCAPILLQRARASPSRKSSKSHDAKNSRVPSSPIDGYASSSAPRRSMDASTRASVAADGLDVDAVFSFAEREVSRSLPNGPVGDGSARPNLTSRPSPRAPNPPSPTNPPVVSGDPTPEPFEEPTHAARRRRAHRRAHRRPESAEGTFPQETSRRRRPLRPRAPDVGFVVVSVEVEPPRVAERGVAVEAADEEESGVVDAGGA